MGILSDFLELWHNNDSNGFNSTRQRKSLRNRICRIEEIEPRVMLSATPYEPPAPINIGVVFHEDHIEQDGIADKGGDTFIVSWNGGADDTTLTELVIDLNVYDVSEYLYFFADLTQHTDKYNNEPFNFTADSNNSFLHSDVKLETDDNGLYTKLTIKFEEGTFTSGKQFIFKIDVNSYSSSNNLVEPVLTGNHFAGAQINAKFESEDYVTLRIDGVFRDQYDDPSTLKVNVPSDLYYDDGRDGTHNTAGVLKTADLLQVPLKGSISGFVYEDNNNDGIKDENENEGIAGVELELFVEDEEGEFQSTGRTQTTNVDGFYRFDDIEGGRTYRVVEVEQPDGYVDGQEQIGTINGISVGEKESPDAIKNIHIGANENGENYNFGELKKGSISGYVYEDKNGNGQKENGENGIKDVVLSLLVWNETQYITTNKTTQTDENGYYQFDGLEPLKKYQVVETQPDNYLDGQETVGYFLGDVTPVGDSGVNDEISAI
ncbi:MAG: MSCRAMM family adhesin SdrC, partial [Planctomycetaceae bacterium]|nr:MSCRAMM family adhesin SdrC [Planctomycetaceae bacterium]